MPPASNPPRLRKASGTVLHHQLFLVLKEQITLGAYAPAALLPSEDELCAQYGVSSITVRRALSELKQLGFVVRLQGKGTFVNPALPQHSAIAEDFVDSLRRSVQDTQIQVLELQSTTPPSDIALQMRIPRDTEAVYSARLRSSGQTPLMVNQAWVPYKFGKSISRKQLAERPLVELLTAMGVKFSNAVEEITAVAASPRHAELLQTDIGVPLIRMTRLMYDQDDLPVEHLTVYLNPARSRVLLKLPPLEVQQGVASRVVHDVSRH